MPQLPIQPANFGSQAAEWRGFAILRTNAQVIEAIVDSSIAIQWPDTLTKYCVIDQRQGPSTGWLEEWYGYNGTIGL